MAEYIERDAICYQLEKQESIDGQPRAIRRARRIIESFPAADVVHMVHGRWKPHSKVETPVFHCSVCGGAALYAFGKQCKSDYCPNCGAKMDEDGDGE